MPEKRNKLTDKQEAFLDYYFGVSKGVSVDAYERAYGTRDSQRAYTVLHNPNVEKAIAERKKKRAALSWLSEDKVLAGLYEEAVNFEQGANSSSRISAWVWIGKHLGMWQEKKQEQQEAKIEYNIVNYNNAERIEKDITPSNTEEEANPQISGVIVADFSQSNKRENESSESK